MTRHAGRREGKIAEHRSRIVLIERHVAYAGVTAEIIVERVDTAIEIIYLIEFFEAADDNGHSVGHSVPHGPNQSVGRMAGLACRYQFSKTFQFASSPFD